MNEPTLVTTKEFIETKERMDLLPKIKRGKEYALSRIDFIQRQLRMVDTKKRMRLLEDLKEWIKVLKHIEEMPVV